MELSLEQNNSEQIELESLNGNQRKSSNVSETKQEDHNGVFDWKISPYFIPLLIVEICLSFADLLSDTWTGFTLMKLENNVWGVLSFVINWVPGLIAAIQIIVDRRDSLCLAILYSLGSILLCPLVPTLTFVCLLCKVPRNSEEERSRDFMKKFQKLLSFVKIVRALEGCIESPLQLLYKTFLMFNGIIDFSVTSTDFALKDLHGNNIPVPFFINFLISCLTLIKSVYSLNIPHFKTETSSKFPAIIDKQDFVGFLVVLLYFPQPRRLYSFPSTFSPVYWLGRRYNIFRLGKRYIVNMTCTFSPFYFFM